MKRLILSILITSALLLTACSTPSDDTTTSTTIPIPTTTTDLTQSTSTTTTIPTNTISPTGTTNQAILNASCVSLVINQSNQEVEPEFSDNLTDYISFLLTGKGLTLADPGEKYDVLLTFNLIAEPLGAEYQGAEDLCYTGADVSGEVLVTPPQGNPLYYDFYGHNPTDQGVISWCPTKKQAPFHDAYAPKATSILADLWGIPIHVYACVWRVEFISINFEGRPAVEITQSSLLDESVASLEALGTDAIPPLIELLSSDDSAVRWAVLYYMYHVDVDITQAIPKLIESLYDPFVITASLPQYDDLYPVREAALKTLIAATDQDFGYDKDQWQNWWAAAHSD